MNWMLLGIEPTKDIKAITTAYRAQLAHTNPEDKPEEFKALRWAYEEALKLAKQNDEIPVQNQSPLEKWKEQICALYDNFPCRIQPKYWEELLCDDICIALDTRPLAEEALLNFLTQNFYIPQSVWETFDRHFHWLEQQDELYESYPKDFVDYAVMNGIRYPENLPYELFIPGMNGNACDEYRKLYYQASQSTNEEMDSFLKKMALLSESHPYGELLNCYLLMENGETERGLKGYQILAEFYPQDAKIQLEWATQCMNLQDWTEAEIFIRRALAIRPDSGYTMQMLAVCMANQGQYEPAKDLIFRLMDHAGGDQKRIYELHQMIQEWNVRLIQQLEEQMKQNPQKMELGIKLAWCYLQNNRESDALQLCQSMDSTYEDVYDYHNLYAKVNYSMGNYHDAYSHLQILVDIIKTMESDGTEETDTRIASLAEKLQMQGSCLINMGNREEALEKYEQALSVNPDNPEVLTHMGRLFCSIGNHNRAAEFFDKLTKILPGSYHGFYLLSQTFYDLGRDRDAFEAVNRALELEGGDLGVYLLKMKILLRNGAWEGVRNILDFLRQHGITDEINTVWCEAQLLEQGEGEKEQALHLYRILAARVENGENMEDASKLYFHLLCLEAEHLDARKSEDRAQMLELAEKGLMHNKNDFSCLDYKAWLLKCDGQREDALAIYHQLEKLPRYSMNVEKELAELYYKDLNRDAEKALYYYKKLIEQEEHPVYFFYAGTCCRYLDLYEEAEEYFLKLQEMNPDGIDGYNGMSYLYDAMKRYEESLEQIDKVLARVENAEGNQSSYYYHKARILRRLNRPLEAINVIDELTKKYGNDDVFREKFDICCQFGLWEQADQILKEWTNSGSNEKELYAAKIDFDLFIGKTDEGRTALTKTADNMNVGDVERLSLMLGELDGDETVQMSILEKNAEKRNDKTHELMNMAQVQWWNGHYDKAREYAGKALIQLDELIPIKKKFEALYRGRRAMVLAILGRFDEAMTELEKVYKLPLCEMCNYCFCKDAEIFQANIEEVRGNWTKALNLHSSGSDRWPDALDFVSGLRRMKRKELK